MGDAKTFLFLVMSAIGIHLIQGEQMTAQASNIIFLENQARILHNTPLERFFDQVGWKPIFYNCCTANNRGYTARWEVFERRLFLTGIVGASWKVPAHLEGKLAPDPDGYDGFPADARTLRLPDLFPDEGLRVPATWVTGVLTVPTGGLLVYVHAGFGSLYASYALVDVVQGRVRQIRNLSARQWADRVGRQLPDDWFEEKPEPIADDLFEPRAFYRTSVDRGGGGWAYERAEVAKLLTPCAEPISRETRHREWRDLRRRTRAWLTSGQR